jgi:phage gpG-like protein
MVNIIAEVAGGEQVVFSLGEKRGKVVDALKTEVRSLAMMLASYVKTNKLSGDPLHVRTGRLRRSITTKTEVSDTLISGLVGTNVEYGRAHEFGVDMHKTVTVREYLRKTVASAKAAKGIGWRGGAAESVAHSQALGAALVHSFTRNQHINLPERSFLRSALAELGPAITEDLNNAVRRALA